jgi:threonine dehydratase
VLSGGNVDSLLLLRIIRHGMAAGGRYLTLRVQVPDAPGSLASLLRVVQDVSANVVEVDHNRIDPKLGVHEVEIDLQVETRGRDHANALLDAIREQGFEVTEL